MHFLLSYTVKLMHPLPQTGVTDGGGAGDGKLAERLPLPGAGNLQGAAAPC